MKDALYANKSLFQLPRLGDIMEGAVIGRESGVLYLDLGPIGMGVIYGKEYWGAQDAIRNLKTGDKVAVKLVELENKDGYRELSMREAGQEAAWQDMKEKKENQIIVEVTIVDANRGGLMVQLGDISGFIPVSQLAPSHYPRVEGGDKEKILGELKKFVGTTMQVHVLDMDQKTHKLILSERAAENEAVREALARYKVDDVVSGEITGIVDFGAFIRFDPLLEGLIHISELDWNLVRDPKDIVSMGDKVKARIVDIAPSGRVSLSIKLVKENPWGDIEKKFKQGDKVTGEVIKINSYGALVKIAEGIQGLVHISEFSSEEALYAKLKEAQSYEFEIATIAPKEHKMTLKLVS